MTQAQEPSAAGIAQLREQLYAMEQLLEIQEQTVAEQGEKLEQQARELRRSNGALEQFAYVISHDLQEPLRMVAAYTELLRERYQGKLDEKADTYIGFASGGARRMQQLINALLDYSRIATKAKPFSSVPLDEVLDDVLANLSLMISESHAEVSRDPLPTLDADREQLLQLLQNLVANGLKFRKDDQPPRLQVRAAVEGKEVHLRFVDSGIGIDPRHHARIFDIFRRIFPRKYPGTGIGLSVCQRIVERHNGRIWVESKAGEGATFHVTLPLTQKESR